MHVATILAFEDELEKLSAYSKANLSKGERAAMDGAAGVMAGHTINQARHALRGTESHGAHHLLCLAPLAAMAGIEAKRRIKGQKSLFAREKTKLSVASRVARAYSRS